MRRLIAPGVEEADHAVAHRLAERDEPVVVPVGLVEIRGIGLGHLRGRQETVAVGIVLEEPGDDRGAVLVDVQVAVPVQVRGGEGPLERLVL